MEIDHNAVFPNTRKFNDSMDIVILSFYIFIVIFIDVTSQHVTLWTNNESLARKAYVYLHEWGKCRVAFINFHFKSYKFMFLQIGQFHTFKKKEDMQMQNDELVWKIVWN